MPKFNEIEDLEPDFAPDLYSREEIDALIAESDKNPRYHRWSPGWGLHGWTPAIVR